MPTPPAFDIAPDYAGLADTFLGGVTGWSPEMLSRYLDASALAEIGISVSNGNYEEAGRQIVEFAGEKAVGAIPVIGQWYALGQVGSGLGDWAIDHFGSGRFDSAYESMSSHFSESDWNRDYGDGNLDTEIVIVENANVLTFIDKQTGGGHSHDELRRMFWTMLQAKHRFESLCDQFGLTGAERTYDNLAAHYQRKLELTTQAARMIEADRVAAEKDRLEEAWRKEQEWQARKQAEEEARNAETCAAWLGKIPFRADYHLPRPGDDLVEEMCGERPQAPVADSGSDQPVDTTGAQDSAPAALGPDAGSATAGPLVWSVASSAGAGQTTFRLTLTNVSGRTVTGVGISAAPAGPYKNGGVIAGASRRTLEPGQSAVFEAIASGGVEAVAISILSAASPAQTVIKECLHETGTNADGSYAGAYAGAGNSGGIELIVRGRSVTGSLSGGYADADQVVSISCAVTGAYDPKTGTLSANWSGAANGRLTGEDGSTFTEPVAGTLSGAFSAGGFSGSWTGGSAYMQDSGQWSASQ